MYKLKLITPLSILLLSLYSINSAEAALLSDLLSGSSVTAADKLFDQWAVTFQSSSDGSVPNYAGININPLNDGGLILGPALILTLATKCLSLGTVSSPSPTSPSTSTCPRSEIRSKITPYPS